LKIQYVLELVEVCIWSHL